MTTMIHGRLAGSDLAATTSTGVYTVPALRKATVTAQICNRNASDVTFRLSLINGAIGALSNSDYLAYGAPVPANGYTQVTGITMAAAQTLGAYASTTGVTVVVFGIEEDA